MQYRGNLKQKVHLLQAIQKYQNICNTDLFNVQYQSQFWRLTLQGKKFLQKVDRVRDFFLPRSPLQYRAKFSILVSLVQSIFTSSNQSSYVKLLCSVESAAKNVPDRQCHCYQSFLISFQLSSCLIQFSEHQGNPYLYILFCDFSRKDKLVHE